MPIRANINKRGGTRRRFNKAIGNGSMAERGGTNAGGGARAEAHVAGGRGIEVISARHLRQQREKGKE